MNRRKSEVIFVHQNLISNRLTYLGHAKATGELISFGFSDRSVWSSVSAKRSANRWDQTKKRLHFLADLWSQSEFRTQWKSQRKTNPKSEMTHYVPMRRATRPNGVQNDDSAMHPNLSSVLCDPDLRPPDRRSWPFRVLAPWTTCASWRDKHRFIRFQNRLHEFGNSQTDGQTNRQVDNIMPFSGSLVCRRRRNVTNFIMTFHYRLV